MIWKPIQFYTKMDLSWFNKSNESGHCDVDLWHWELKLMAAREVAASLGHSSIFTALCWMHGGLSHERNVRPSVCQTRVLWQNERNLCPYSQITWKTIYLSFMTRRMVGRGQGGFTGRAGAAPHPSPSKKRKKGVRRGHPEYLKCSKTVWRTPTALPQTP